jgi:hypothetical protein
MIQSLAPLALRPARSSLRLAARLPVALASSGLFGSSIQPVRGTPSRAAESEPVREPDEESHDTENQAETIAWPEAVAERRSAPRAGFASPAGILPQPGRSARRTGAALQQDRALPILAAAASGVAARLGRFLC